MGTRGLVLDGFGDQNLVLAERLLPPMTAAIRKLANIYAPHNPVRPLPRSQE